MPDKKFTNYRLYYNFLNGLAKELTRFYYKKLDRPFKVINKNKKKGYDPVTQADREFEKFIRLKIKKKFPNHQVIGEELGYKKTKSDYTWVLDPIDGTRSFIIGNPTWSNLIALNYKGRPVMGLANYPKLNKYYLNYSDKIAYVFEKSKKKKLTANKKVTFNHMKVAGAFHGWLSLNKQKKIPKVLKLMQFPCFDSLSYSHLAEGRIDVVLQCSNKVWDIHPIIPIVKASGGIISTWKNENAVKAGNILVSANKLIHERIIKLLKPVTK
jgi:histidinol phosphatase-like enzyme (inositol monophosphatase family)